MRCVVASVLQILNKLLRRPSVLSRARSLRGFAQLGMLITLIQSFPKGGHMHNGEV